MKENEMSQTITAPQSIQILKVRETPHKKCTECGNGIQKGQQVVRVGEIGSGLLAHRDCAGIENKIETCTECFMVKDNCLCGL